MEEEKIFSIWSRLDQQILQIEGQVHRLRKQLFIVAALLAILSVAVGARAMDFSARIGTANMGASLGGLDLKGSKMLTEFALSHYVIDPRRRAPQAWARYQFSLPQEWSGEADLNEKSIYYGIEFDKGRVKSRLSSQSQRLEVGCQLLNFKPYWAAQWIRGEIELTPQAAQLATAAATAQGKSFKTSNNWNLFGGGARFESWQFPVYVYVDGSVMDRGNHRVETGFRYHNGPSFLGGAYRYDRINLNEMTGNTNSWFGEMGLQF